MTDPIRDRSDAEDHSEAIDISVVIPVYHGAPYAESLFGQLRTIICGMDLNYEVIMVDDCGADGSWPLITALAAENSELIGIKLSRNFGQHAAITAGLHHTRGQWIVVMDCDLQDQPSEIPKLYRKAMEGYDVVVARRRIRQDSILKRAGSYVFYKVLGYLTDTEQDHTVANFGVYNRKVIDAVVAMNDYIRYFPAMIRWVGFRVTAIDVAHAPRTAGRSSYSIGKLLSLGLDIVLTFSDKPLRLTVTAGLVISAVGLLVATYYLILYFSGLIEVMGYTSIIVSIWLLFGVTITTVGIVGLYVGKSFDQVKRRPIYVIDRTARKRDA